MIVDTFAKNINTLNRLNVVNVAWLIKEQKIFQQSKKQDVFGLFTDWLRQEFDLPVALNLECSTVVIVMPLVF